jgi:hypothetical protein
METASDSVIQLTQGGGAGLVMADKVNEETRYSVSDVVAVAVYLVVVLVFMLGCRRGGGRN